MRHYSKAMFFILVLTLGSCGGKQETPHYEKIIIEKPQEKEQKNDDTREKITRVIKEYCNKLSTQRYTEIESYFAKNVRQYIGLKNTSAAIIAREANRFLSTKTNVRYSADLNKLKLTGKKATIPVNISWEGYTTKVMTEIAFDEAYKITLLKETKILKQASANEIKVTRKEYKRIYEEEAYKRMPCTVFSVNYVKVVRAPNQAVKNATQRKIDELLYSHPHKPKEHSSLEHQGDFYEDQLVNYVKVGLIKPESGINTCWFEARDVTIEETQRIATVVFSLTTHEIRTQWFLGCYHFDKATGKAITMDDIFVDNYKPELIKIATRSLRQENNIPLEKPLNETGFRVFANNEIQLPLQYKFEKDGILFSYSNYFGGLGNFQFRVKYQDISHLIKKDGLLGEKVK